MKSSRKASGEENRALRVNQENQENRENRVSQGLRERPEVLVRRVLRELEDSRQQKPNSLSPPQLP